MKVLVVFSVLFFLLQSCHSKSNQETKQDSTTIFHKSERDLIFSLSIDDKFSYYNSLKNKDIILGYEIGRYPKQFDRPSTIHLRINDKDTSFQFDLYKVDSILFGLNANRSFYIITNHDKAGWILD